MENNKPYRLLVVAPASVHLRNFLKRIESETSAIHIISTAKNELGFEETVLDFSYRRIFNFSLTPRAIREVYRDFKPDVVHCHQLNSLTFFTLLALKKSGVPIVATAWGSDVLLTAKRGGFLKWVLKYNLRNVDALTSDAQEVTVKMKEIAGKPLDISLCNYGADQPSLVLPKEKIIYSNRLHNPLYRIDQIIEHFAAFRKKPDGKDWKLIIAGSGSETETLKTLTEELGISGHVDFQGWVEKEQNEKNYARAAVWVSIPESDATPISLLEAMYHGCYPVVGDLPSLREWITDGDNGKLISDLNTPMFADYLNKINGEIADRNRRLIELKGSAEVATACFSGLHRRMIQNAQKR